MTINSSNGNIIQNVRRLRSIIKSNELDDLLRGQENAEIPKEDFMKIDDFLGTMSSTIGLIMTETAFKYFVNIASFLEEDDLDNVAEDDLINDIVSMIGYKRTAEGRTIIGVRKSYCTKYGVFGILFILEALLDSKKALVSEVGDILNVDCGSESCALLLNRRADELYNLLTDYSSAAGKLLFDKLSRKVLHFTSYQKSREATEAKKLTIVNMVTGF